MSKGKHWIIEFVVGDNSTTQDSYGAIICHDYTLTEQEIGSNDETPNLVPVYKCSHVDLCITGSVIMRHSDNCTVDAINVRRIHAVDDEHVAIKHVMDRRFGCIDHIMQEDTGFKCRFFR